MSPLLFIEFVIVYLILCTLVGFLGRRRRIGFWGFFFASILMTPLLAAIFIFLAAPAKRRRPVVKRT